MHFLVECFQLKRIRHPHRAEDIVDAAQLSKCLNQKHMLIVLDGVQELLREEARRCG